MNMKLKDAVRQVAEAEALSDEQLAELRALIDRTAPVASTAPARRRSHRVARLTVAASVIVGLLVGFWLAQPAGPHNRVAELADEIAKNHIAAKSLDVQGTTLGALREPFAVLGFALQDLPEGRTPGQLVGGRYCSVQTVPAALLRYRTKGEDAGYVTVYEAPYDLQRHGRLPDLDQGERPVVVQTRGIEVEIWTSRGLLFATAQHGATAHQP